LAESNFPGDRAEAYMKSLAADRERESWAVPADATADEVRVAAMCVVHNVDHATMMWALDVLGERVFETLYTVARQKASP
jgi:hypothetical protein